MQEPRVLADFFGEWRIDRVIRHADGTQMTLQGTTLWLETNTGALQRETGFLRLPKGDQLRAQRNYLWERDLRVYFDDGRFFHTVPAMGGEAQHWCDPDNYMVRYAFESDNIWHSSWTVQGPRKSYRMETRYDRVV